MNDDAPSTAIVTGGAGFIGSHVVDALLARGTRVWVVDDLSTGIADRVASDAELVQLDITDREALAAFERSIGGAERWFHLAAQIDVRVSLERPLDDASANVLGTVAVLETARQSGSGVVFSSTGGAIYGEAPTPSPESTEERPESFYGAAKLAAEKYVQMHARLYGLPHVVVRYANVYGPRQDPHGEGGVVAIFGGIALDGGTPTVYGDGTQTRDYTYVGDVVEATLAAGAAAAAAPTAQEAALFNVGTGVETNVLQLWDAVCELTGHTATPTFAPRRAGELERSALDATLARERLGVALDTDLGTGLRHTIEWMRTTR